MHAWNVVHYQCRKVIMSCLFLACSKDGAALAGEHVEAPFCAVTDFQCCLHQSSYVLLSEQDTD